MSERMTEAIARTDGLYRKMADSDPALRAGIVHCCKCGQEQRVDSAHCLAHGWPTCCGYTMSLGRRALANGGEHG